MISVNLLPKRYRDAKAIERFLIVGIVVLAICLLVLLTINLSLKVQTTLLQQETKALKELANQYQMVNKRYEDLKSVEAELTHRLELARPLIAKDGSILPYLNYFQGEFPRQIWLTWLDLRLNGEVYVEGKALAYSDVAAFIKWLEEDRNLAVTLGDTERGEELISFSLTATAYPKGGERG